VSVSDTVTTLDVIVFNLCNWCDSRMDDRMKLVMFNLCDTGQNRCHMRAAATVAVATNRHDDRIMQTSCNRPDKTSGHKHLVFLLEHSHIFTRHVGL